MKMSQITEMPYYQGAFPGAETADEQLPAPSCERKSVSQKLTFNIFGQRSLSLIIIFKFLFHEARCSNVSLSRKALRGNCVSVVSLDPSDTKSRQTPTIFTGSCRQGYK